MKNHDTRRSAQAAFTIVEIVIVVTVLLILVSITAIGYRAIVQDSHKETVKTDAQAAAAVLAEEYNRKGAYPATFDGLVVKGATSSFQYSYNSIDGTYCLTASVEGASAYVRSDSMRPTEGGCEGHGVNGEESGG